MKKYYDSLSKALFLYNFSIRSRLILYFLSFFSRLRSSRSPSITNPPGSLPGI